MKLGFVINPMAGIGGSVALKGSDGQDIAEQALSLGALPQAQVRARTALEKINDTSLISFLAAASSMGEDVLRALNLECEVVYSPSNEMSTHNTSAQDTKSAIRSFIDNKVDLIVFAGGDGTARDVLDILADEKHSSIPVVGIPAGVKIHSAVYAITPTHAGELIGLIANGEAMSLVDAQVMDLDEQAFRAGKVNAKCYGYLSVPVDDTRMQLIKQGGLNSEEIAVEEIAADIIEGMEDGVYYIVGSGSTTAEIMQQLGLRNTLLGVDIVYNQQVIANDADEQKILEIINGHPAKIIVTVIGGQGHVFGRGNQQLSAKVISQVIGQKINRGNIIIVATNEKLRSLENRPMIGDTNDTQLDSMLSGLYTVVTGYQQKTLYKLNE